MLISNAAVAQQNIREWEWNYLAPIPDSIGFAGAYVGIVNDFLIVAGGANFPDGRTPWEGGKKVWTDKMFYLKQVDGEWKEGSSLPQQMGYGASVSYNNKMYIAGGSDAGNHLNSVYEIYWDNSVQDIRYNSLAKLPNPVANCSSVLIGDYWYIIGGIISPQSPEAESSCWRLDLKNPLKEWEKLTPLPPPGRMLSIAANMNGNLMVFSGVALVNSEREYLQDAYHLDLSGEWVKLIDLPTSVTAAAGPAFFDESSNSLYIIGGDDGELASADLKHKHPGFSSSILQYNGENWLKYSIKNHSKSSEIKFPVTTGAVVWKGNYIIPSGEIRPGIRTPKVLSGKLILK